MHALHRINDMEVRVCPLQYSRPRQLDIAQIEPAPYVEFLNLVTGARAVITDSGGLQEETTYLGIPCLTLRENTERPITVTLGTNKLVNAQSLAQHLESILNGEWHKGQRPPLWDGETAARAVECLRRRAIPDV